MLIFEIFLAAVMIVVGFSCPYIQWEVFASASTLYSFRDNIFIWIVVLFALSLVGYMPKFKSKQFLQLTQLLVSLIIFFLIISTSSVSGRLPDGTNVMASKRFGFYLELGLIIIYSILSFIYLLNNARKKHI